MADDDKFKLTQEQRNHIAEFLTQKNARHACPACGTNNWLVGEHVIRGELFTAGTTLLGGPAYPLAFVVCQNCFFVRPHLAIPLGVVAPDPEPPAETKAPTEQVSG